jgi:hypothetical protein
VRHQLAEHHFDVPDDLVSATLTERLGKYGSVSSESVPTSNPSRRPSHGSVDASSLAPTSDTSEIATMQNIKELVEKDNVNKKPPRPVSNSTARVAPTRTAAPMIPGNRQRRGRGGAGNNVYSQKVSREYLLI